MEYFQVLSHRDMGGDFFADNPSVSFADSSPYTGEPLKLPEGAWGGFIGKEIWNGREI